MISDPQVTFRDIDPSPALTEYVLDRAKKLDALHSRITACHVVVEAPHRHHHHGRHYRIRVNLTVPGGDLVTGTRGDDERVHEDAYAAIDDAFDEAQRVLRDFVQRQRGY
ncbi:MAG: ribosome-associated translation inhibitor RaiA [Deltaproteobacteria bacterium]|nr:ribosome-associated translation inhibitor RaiA [Deltaproteobacteria bacterium]